MNLHNLIPAHFNWLLPLLIIYVFKVVLLSVALWIMLKIQDLNYNIPGMIGSAALASVFDMIPMVGHYAAVAALLLCVLKLTQSEFIDVRFTVAVSYAVMFLIQMLILSAVPTTLHVNARSSKPGFSLQKTDGADDSADPDADADTEPAAAMTNRPVVKPAVVAVTNKVATNKVAPLASPAPAPAPLAAAPAAPKKAPIEYVKAFRLKGVVRNDSESTAIVDMGGKTTIMTVGETKTAHTADGDIDFSLEQVTPSGALFRSGNQTTLLRLN